MEQINETTDIDAEIQKVQRMIDKVRNKRDSATLTLKDKGDMWAAIRMLEKDLNELKRQKKLK